jgi:hypothetical protein
MSVFGIKVSEEVIDKVFVKIGVVWVNMIAIAIIISAIFGIDTVYVFGVGFAGSIIIILNYGLLSMYAEVSKDE